jgi:hypothetical protein
MKIPTIFTYDALAIDTTPCTTEKKKQIRAKKHDYYPTPLNRNALPKKKQKQKAKPEKKITEVIKFPP